MKKLLHIVCSLLACLSIFLLPVKADNTDYVKDAYGLLTEQEQTELENTIQGIVDTYGVGLYIRLLPDMEGYSNIENYAEKVYKEEDLGIGEEKAGLMLIMEFYDRSYDLCAYGDTAHIAFTDYGKSVIEDAMLSHFKNSDWVDGFNAFITEAEYELEQSANGTPVDIEFNEESSGPSTLTCVLMYSLAPILALIITVILANKNKTKGIATEASAYITKEGLNLSTSLDLYSHTTRTVRHIPPPSNNDSSSGGTSVNSGGFSHSSGHF